MGTSKSLKEKFEQFGTAEVDRLIRMGWEDRTTFESIRLQFSLTPNEFVKFMRLHLDSSTFKRWRKRIFEQGHLKNETHRGYKTTRFKCSRQSVDGITKGWK